MITLSGEVSRLRFGAPAGGFQVFDVLVSAPSEYSGSLVTAVGDLPEVEAGFSVRLNGDFQRHPRYGSRFRFSSGMVVVPSSGTGLRAFLGSGRIEGVGKVLAGKLHDHFGDGLRDALDRGAPSLTTCPGIGKVRAESISAAWKRSASIREAVILLCDMGLTSSQAARIAGKWGESAPARVAADPWELQRQLRGFGFLSADRIALAIGISRDSPVRLAAAIRFVLSQAGEAGHLFLPFDRLLEQSCALAGVPADKVSSRLETMAAAGELVSAERDGGRILFLPHHWKNEMETAEALSRLALAGVGPVDPGSFAGSDRLAPSQFDALHRLCSCSVSVLTGGPGTGKTTVTASLTAMCREKGIRIALCAPTGRAAMRIRETSGCDAMTIHRMLEYNPATDCFARNPSNPIDADWVVVDESSMIDTEIFFALVSAVRPGCRITFVGDADQLPPVGPGDPFRQLIASGMVPVARLTEVFRQAEGSSIVSAAHNVLAGVMPRSDTASESDPGEFHVVMREDPLEAAAMVVTLVCDRIPARFGLDPVRDIQVLAPMRKGSCGTDAINDALRRRLNPACVDEPEGRFLAGDRVMQTRNNYDLDVFNGDIGLVVGDASGGGIVVGFDGRQVVFRREDLDDIAPASAVTVHKSQGSEFPAVVICMHNQHYVMLRRNLLYTALTRGRKVVVLVGSAKAIGMALSNFGEEPRNTLLALRIREAVGRAATGRQLSI